jgi:hypothetical protein
MSNMAKEDKEKTEINDKPHINYIKQTFTFVTMYIINESDDDFFIEMYSKFIQLGIDEAKILIVHALTDTKFPFIEKYKLDMNYIVKYRDIHMTLLNEEGQNIRLSFDLPDKKMMLDHFALEYLSERVTSLSKKLGNLITKLTVVSADFEDLDTLEVLLGSIKGNFPHIKTYEFKTESICFKELTSLLSHKILKRFKKVSFLGESRHEKDVIKSQSYLFFQSSPSSPIQHVQVSSLTMILSQNLSSWVTTPNFILLYSLQGMMFSPINVEFKPIETYFSWLKFLNDQENLEYPLIIVPNHNIKKSAWKFNRKQPLIPKIYGETLSIRMTDNLPISKWDTFILEDNSATLAVSASPPQPENSRVGEYEETYFRIYEVVSKIGKDKHIELSLEVYKSLGVFRNIVELVAGINLKSLNVFIKSYEYNKNQEDHIFLTKLLKSWKSLQNFKFNGYRFHHLTESKLIAAKKLIDQFYIEESMINYTPSDVWDIADF